MAGGHSRLDKLQLDNTQFTNFQKLRYFGLAFTTGQHGEWHITNTGRARTGFTTCNNTQCAGYTEKRGTSVYPRYQRLRFIQS